MRIAIWHNLPSGGGKRCLFDQVRELRQRGHSIEVWCPSTANRSFLPLEPFAREHVLPLDWEPRRARGRVAEFLWHYESWKFRLEAMRRHCEQSAAEINRGGFDLLFAHTSMVTAVTPIAQLVQVPSAIYLHEPLRQLYEATEGLPWIAARPQPDRPRGLRGMKRFAEDLVRVQGLRLLAREEYESARAFNQILVNSYFSREGALRAYGLDSAVSYPGVDVSFFQDLGLPRERFLVGVGAFHPVKNIELAIRAIATLPEPRPALVWIGNSAVPSYVDELAALARSLGVEFKPRHDVSMDELLKLLNRATLMIYTSRLEPFGFAPLEANACGLPVVGIPEGGIRETVVDGVNGITADPTPRAVGSAVRRLFEDPQLARRLGRQGRERVERMFSVEVTTDRLEELLFQTAGRERESAIPVIERELVHHR